MVMERRDFAAAFTALTAAITAHAQATGITVNNGSTVGEATSPNGKKRPKNGECPQCGTQHVAISKPVTGCKNWVPGPNGTAVCPPDKVNKPTVPDNALAFGEVFGVRCLFCSNVFIQDPE